MSASFSDYMGVLSATAMLTTAAYLRFARRGRHSAHRAAVQDAPEPQDTAPVLRATALLADPEEGLSPFPPVPDSFAETGANL